jgi:type III restriction enzyme
MKLKFKHQPFQADAASAVCDVFIGQPYQSPSFRRDLGSDTGPTQLQILDEMDATGYNNYKVFVSDQQLLDNVRRIQQSSLIQPSKALEGKYNLTIEMETGVGKTYTYIKTMYELNKRYGWTKFIIVVPSIAIREGVYKSFSMTVDHFVEEYNKKIRYFIYNSQDLTKLDKFASDAGINVMIINSQAFNAKGKDARRISMALDSFRSRRPIDVIAATNPILIIDEPQSVEGERTKERLKDFNPLMTLRYSATHKAGSIYNLIYRLDAIDAYNQKLVKKIEVKGISIIGTTATEGYVFLEKINLSGDRPPTANLEFEIKGVHGISSKPKVVYEGYNLYEHSGNLEQYKGYTVSRIHGLTQTISFTNGVELAIGQARGNVNEAQIRRIQIRETIQSHFERERQLYYRGIKVLSLFFIDEVAKYKQYDSAGTACNGEYADIFEEEYRDVLEQWQLTMGEDEYMNYVSRIEAQHTHAGYFSIDKKTNRITESKIDDRTERTSDDADAYNLIMKDKERLLDFKEPVRFIFSHSALREGWDNPNVFQICTLKHSESALRKRQEVGRGLRLCVNQDGERMDQQALGTDVHHINVLTVVANESYEDFANALQKQIAESVSSRPREVTVTLFEHKVIRDVAGQQEVTIDHEKAVKIHYGLIQSGYIDAHYHPTQKYYDDCKSGHFQVAEEFALYQTDLIRIVDSIYDPQKSLVDDGRKNDVDLKISDEKLHMKEFKSLWNKINTKSFYTVDFNSEELVRNAIQKLNKELVVSQIFFHVVRGGMDRIESTEALESGTAFQKITNKDTTSKVESVVNSNVKYDLIGKIVEGTGLTRSTVGQILREIQKSTFDQFRRNPEEFIMKASRLINEEKATMIIQHITYNRLDDTHSTSIFTEGTYKGKLGHNAIKAERHLYDHIIYDSINEKNFASELDKNPDVAVYVKLPSSFYIHTPVGKYNPDWAIAFYEGNIKHIYFVAETKGDLSTLQLRGAEKLKIHCAKEHFKKISSELVTYDAVENYQELLQKVMK